jgi:hydroxymethylglutaryl-CoA lyase
MTAPNPRPYTPRAELRDVTLRDGLQLTAKMLPTERKIQIVRELLALGVPELEIGSMARGDLVPPLADTLDVIAALEPDELQRCWIWVATPRHVEKAAAAGARKFQYCFSATDSHNKANIGRSTEDSVAAMPDAVRIAREVDGSIQLCIATAFTCPFEGVGPQAGDRHRRRPAHRRSRRHRGLRRHRPYPESPTSSWQSGPGTPAPHHVPATHLGTGRSQHLAAIDAGAHHGRRFAGVGCRSRGRQRAHLRQDLLFAADRNGSPRLALASMVKSPTSCSPRSVNNRSQAGLAQAKAFDWVIG